MKKLTKNKYNHNPKLLSLINIKCPVDYSQT